MVESLYLLQAYDENGPLKMGAVFVGATALQQAQFHLSRAQFFQGGPLKIASSAGQVVKSQITKKRSAMNTADPSHGVFLLGCIKLLKRSATRGCAKG